MVYLQWAHNEYAGAERKMHVCANVVSDKIIFLYSINIGFVSNVSRFNTFFFQTRRINENTCVAY
jgi:hypothetical protein